MSPFDFLSKILQKNPNNIGGHSPGFLKNNDAQGVQPPLEGEKSGKTLDPADIKSGQGVVKDPKVIYDDQGNIVDYDMGALNGSTKPFDQFLKKQMMDISKRTRTSDAGDTSGSGSTNPFTAAYQATQGQGMGNGQGSISGMLAKLMGNNPTDVGSATSTDQLSGGNATTDQMSPKPTAQTPPKTYAQPTALPIEAIPELRSSLYVGAGIDPSLANSPETTRGVIKGNLSDSPVTGMSTEDIPPGANPMDYLQPGKRSDAGGNPFQQVAGDVVPLRPPGPTNNAGEQNQRQNEQKQNPDLSDPANSNIVKLYG